MGELTEGDIVILSTGLVALRRSFGTRVVCTDGKIRQLSDEDALRIITTLCELIGRPAPVKSVQEARELAREAGIGGRSGL